MIIEEQIKSAYQCSIENGLHKGLCHAIECGRLLVEQKKQSPHGTFKDWVILHCSFSFATANIYMRAYRLSLSGIPFNSLNESRLLTKRKKK